MIFEHEARAIILAVAAAAVEGHQVGARVVVLGVAAVGGFFEKWEGVKVVSPLTTALTRLPLRLRSGQALPS